MDSPYFMESRIVVVLLKRFVISSFSLLFIVSKVSLIFWSKYFLNSLITKRKLSSFKLILFMASGIIFNIKVKGEIQI